jgi:hypothetical protein
MAGIADPCAKQYRGSVYTRLTQEIVQGHECVGRRRATCSPPCVDMCIGKQDRAVAGLGCAIQPRPPRICGECRA